MLSSVPDEWGPKYERDGGAATWTLTGPNAISYTAQFHMALVMLTAQPERRIALNSDRPHVGLAPVGSLEIIPASSDLYACWTAEKQSLLVAIDPDRLQRLACLEFENDTFELCPPKLGFIDEKAHALSQWMRQELAAIQFRHDECLDALISLFSIHLLRHYSSLKDHHQSFTGGLPPGSWRMVNDYIQAHLAEHLSLERLASVVQLSPSHFARAFRQTTGQSPYQYVISARLQHAQNLIATTEARLSDIAKAAGFSSNSHMTALMRRIWGTTPTAFRKARRGR